SVGDVVRLEDLGGESADGDKVAAVDLGRLLAVAAGLVVTDVVPRRGDGREVEQAEARQRGDDRAALQDAGQRQAELKQFRVVGPQPAHRQKANLHGTPRRSVQTAARSSNATGTKKRERSGFFQAARKHTAGMATPRAANPAEARVSSRPGPGEGESANTTFIIPSAARAMCPSRASRRRYES